jgi:hypothetical protein
MALIVMLPLLFAPSHAWSGGVDKIFYSYNNYVFSGKWTQEEIDTITRLQDRAKELLRQCRGYITPMEQETIMAAYERPMIIHIKNNHLGKNIGASAASRRSIENATPLALEAQLRYGYSAMQINVKELFPRGEKEILKTLLHEMAHNASPDYTHPSMAEIWNLPARTLKPGRNSSEYYETVPLRVENCVREDNLTDPGY